MKCDPLKATHAERGEAVFVLQATERALDGSSATVEVAEPLAFTRDQRVKPRCLPPHRGGLELARRAAPLRPTVLEIGPGERPVPVLAGRLDLEAKPWNSGQSFMRKTASTGLEVQELLGCLASGKDLDELTEALIEAINMCITPGDAKQLRASEDERSMRIGAITVATSPLVPA